MLAAAGVRGWACVPLIRPGRVRGIMGFDTCWPVSDRVFPLPVLRLAGDVVASALEREFLEARPSETHDAPGTSAPHANDWIAGKRDCA
jgi:hypothetical protein